LNPPQVASALVPPGGYRYEQPMADGSYCLIVGGSLDDICQRILAFRLANGMAVKSGTLSTPEGAANDYHAQVCAKYPWVCTPQVEPLTPIRETGTGATGFEMLYARMQRWVDFVRSNAQDWVDQKTASDRANVCVGCPQNVAWETNCGACNSNLVRTAAAITGARRVANGPQLKGCRSFGTLQALAVWLSNPGGDNKYPRPPQCWRAT
jgi:hypothetical protein